MKQNKLLKINLLRERERKSRFGFRKISKGRLDDIPVDFGKLLFFCSSRKFGEGRSFVEDVRKVSEAKKRCGE